MLGAESAHEFVGSWVGSKNNNTLTHTYSSLLKSRELQSVGVRVLPSNGGYYLMPDFEVCRSGLFKKKMMKGVAAAAAAKTSNQMCNIMLKEAKVAVSATY